MLADERGRRVLPDFDDLDARKRTRIGGKDTLCVCGQGRMHGTVGQSRGAKDGHLPVSIAVDATRIDPPCCFRMTQTEIRLVRKPRNRHDRSRCDAYRLAKARAFGRGQGRGPAFDQRIEHVDMTDALAQRGKARIVELRHARHAPDLSPLLFRARADEYPAIARAVCVPGRACRMTVADAADRIPHKGGRQERRERTRRATEQRDVDVLDDAAHAPDANRRGNRSRRIQRRRDIRERNADTYRLAMREAGGIHQAADRLNLRVGPGSARARTLRPCRGDVAYDGFARRLQFRDDAFLLRRTHIRRNDQHVMRDAGDRPRIGETDLRAGSFEERGAEFHRAAFAPGQDSHIVQHGCLLVSQVVLEATIRRGETPYKRHFLLARLRFPAADKAAFHTGFLARATRRACYYFSMRTLPSLNALRAFEVCGRLLSVQLAANELNVTPAAVSRQIKLLEDQLGVQLFERGHRAIALTTMEHAIWRTSCAASRPCERPPSISPRRDAAARSRFAATRRFR